MKENFEKALSKKEYDKKRYVERRDIVLEQSRDYYQSHKAQNKERSRVYYLNNADKIKERSRRWVKNNKVRMTELARKWSQERRKEWMEIIESKGMNKCARCGYDESFVAIDFHHKNPNEKEREVGLFLGLRITQKRLDELDKCIPLCSNCHRIVHHGGSIERVV